MNNLQKLIEEKKAEFEKDLAIQSRFNPKEPMYGEENHRDIERLKLSLEQALTQAHALGREEAVGEEHQFFLNVLDGIDIADKQMGNKGGGTKAIRFALKSRYLITISKKK